ncbi:MAG: hypothetical protein Q8L09_04345 [Candidatus Moranbacteria bacterium]|nr:hypothetical protein [Candidatus Moranbacteria bacterium]
MSNVNIWIIFGVVAVVLLIVFWRKRNAVWGGLTAGIIIGIIVAIFYLFKGNKFDWFLIGKGAIVGAILGFIAELLGKISDHIRRKG